MTGMLRKKEFVTIITPIPGFIPRQLAIDILHSHSEVITLNPLVLEHKPIKAPRDAASDEYYSTWYEIIERIQYVPGLGRMGSGKISFNGCFHNMPWGLQAHIYAPMNVDLRYKYRIAGNQSGVEPPEILEMGLTALGAPSDGLYLREDVEVKCSIAVMSFVKSQLKAASKLMVERIIKKAELVDAGVLHAMMENGKLKTHNPADRSSTMTTSPAPSPSPALTNAQDKETNPQQNSPPSRTETPNSPPPVPYQVPRPQSMQAPYGYRPASAGVQQYQGPGSPGLGVYPGYQGYQGYQGYGSPHPGHASYAGPPGGSAYYAQQPQQMHPGMYAQHAQQPPPQGISELQSPPVNPSAVPGAHFAAVEMPGDYYHPQTLPQPPPIAPGHQTATATPQASTTYNNRDSEVLGTGQWTAASRGQNSPGLPGSRPDSVASDASGGAAGTAPGGYRSPGLDKSFSSDLATHRETPDEHRLEALNKLDPNASATGQQPAHMKPAQNGGYVYNPADYAPQVRGR